MSGVLCNACQGYFQASDHLCGDEMSRRLEERVALHEKTQRELALTKQGVSSAVQDIRRLEAEVKTLQEEAMRRDTLPDFERGEYAGQDAMIKHIGLLKEDYNSQLAEAVRACPLFKIRGEVFRQIAEYLEVATYKIGVEFDPEAAKALRNELSLLQARAEKYAIPKEE